MQVESDVQEPCPGCGKPRAEWTDGDGNGFVAGDLVFCSQDCVQKNQDRLQQRRAS
ncbi:MAG TPA: hypothetical protein VK131_00775 [Candidatus Acidoferrales bacterium]|nr:hypothetical protein [Candidatus Acidoferrales bacterium]